MDMFTSESALIDFLLEQLQWSASTLSVIQQQALVLAQYARTQAPLIHYDLSSKEGIALMQLAEALLRIPDAKTADALIADKLGQASWTTLQMLSKLAAPVSRITAKCVIKWMGKQFVMGETIESALSHAPHALCSFDMLGEAACTDQDAEYYMNAYTHAIHTVGKEVKNPVQSNGVSIKLSALHPHFDVQHWEISFPFIYERLEKLALLSKSYNINMTIDAEESDRLEFQLALFRRLMQLDVLREWEGLGIAVQAYQTRAYSVIERLAQWTKEYDRKIMIRLVKGAYWDTEIKRAQVLGLEQYPVFTRKISTDVAYLACAQLLRKHTDNIYVQFATHNAYTLAAVLHLFKGVERVEIQRLHGMGKALHDKAVALYGVRSRVYAPVGGYQHLLMYLVRRLLENGANSSFVNQISDTRQPIEALVQSPITALRAIQPKSNPRIPMPRDILGGTRLTSRGADVTDLTTLKEIQSNMHMHFKHMPWHAAPLLAQDDAHSRTAIPRYNPSVQSELIGHVAHALPEEVPTALAAAQKAYATWALQPVESRTAIIRCAAALLDKKRDLFYAILIKEAGKTLSNAVGEVREAIDFCHYYADQAEKLMSAPMILPGPTGEHNEMTYRGRGPMVCISPWNFPLSIFAGQIIASLVVGNTVLAKPAKQTSIIAYEAVKLFHEAGVPRDVLQLLLGDGATLGMALVKEPHTAGVILTGSTDTARQINQTLAAKPGPIVPLIAETGGQNAQIVDSSALLEQVVMDALTSAFDSAGQRCSALRVLFIQEEIADSFITMLKGAIDTLTLGDPIQLAVDVGPVIDAGAQATLEAHIAEMRSTALWVYQGKPTVIEGFYVPPTVCEIASLDMLKGEVFGPILHLIRYGAADLDKVVAAINSTGYGLTFGMESRIESRYKQVTNAIAAGNAYVNRNMIGALVGVQPFGGQGLSGTGPKAGGPHYLLRLVHERVLTLNTAAIGGNVEVYL